MGTFKQSCPFCGTRIEVDEIYAGSKANCPKCGRIIELKPGTEYREAPQPPSRPQPPSQNNGPANPGYPPPNNGPANPGYPPPNNGQNIAAMLDQFSGNLFLSILFSCLRWIWDFLMFRRMIFRIWAIFISFLIAIGGIIFAIVCFCRGEVSKGFTVIGALILIRFLQEWFLVFFAINDSLTSIKNNLSSLKK